MTDRGVGAGAPVEPHEVVISYSRDDSERVGAIAADLERSGVSVWIDQTDLDGAVLWGQRIAEAIETCQVLVLMTSSSSVVSRNVIREVAVAFDLGKPILPINLEPVDLPSSMRYQLAGIQHIEAYEDIDHQQAIGAALRSLEALGVSTSGGPPPPAVTSPRGSRLRVRRRVPKVRSSKAILGVAAALVLVVGGVLYLNRDDDKGEEIPAIPVNPPTSYVTLDRTVDFLAVHGERTGKKSSVVAALPQGTGGIEWVDPEPNPYGYVEVKYPGGRGWVFAKYLSPESFTADERDVMDDLGYTTVVQRVPGPRGFRALVVNKLDGDVNADINVVLFFHEDQFLGVDTYPSHDIADAVFDGDTILVTYTVFNGPGRGSSADHTETVRYRRDGLGIATDDTLPPADPVFLDYMKAPSFIVRDEVGHH